MPRLCFGPRRIYLVGGFERGEGVVSTVLAYDPALDSYSEVASMAMERCSYGAVALGSKLYVVGGTDDGDAVFAEAEVYDPKADGWQLLPSMPTARRCLAAAAVAGKVYAIGGRDDDDNKSDTVDAYDPLSGAWTRVASLSVARSSLTATVLDGKIYVLGGVTIVGDDHGHFEESVDRVDVYDPAADSWQQVAAMPTRRSSHAAALLDGKIYVTGGYTSLAGQVTRISHGVEAYDPVADTWTKLASLSKPRAQHASAVFSGKLYVFGGYSLNGRTDLVEVYSPALNSWERAADLPSAIDETVAIAL